MNPDCKQEPLPENGDKEPKEEYQEPEEEYHIPGEYFYFGIPLIGSMTEAKMERIRQGTQTFYPDDIFLVSYLKTGTTVTQELIYSVWNGPDKSQARTETMNVVFPFLEAGPEDGIRYDKIDQLARPRMMATHLLPFMYEKALDDPDQCPKVIFLLREAKDTLVSCYHWYMNFNLLNFTGTWNQFFDAFKGGRLSNGDLVDFNIEWWKKLRNYPKALILHYEDIIGDKRQAIMQVARFLEKDLGEEDVSRIANDSSFEAMKSRGTQSYHTPSLYKKCFFRKGVKGDWTNHFSEEQLTFMGDHIRGKMEAAGILDYPHDDAFRAFQLGGSENESGHLS